MHILIGADLVPTESNQDLFQAGDARSLLGDDLQSLLAAADYRIFNLEVPLTDLETPIKKCGPNLIAPAASVAGYKAIGANILTLANNHILDQGAQGLQSTCSVLKENGIAYLGVGDTPEQAAAPYIFTFASKRIGIYACAEHEFSIVTAHSAGANPFDPLESPDHIQALKAQCDYVIVLYHGGKEHYRYPSPGLQKVCRKLVEKGADLVVCQHSHCIGCEEKYLHGTIVYGQGNFLFDHSTSEFWKTSLLIRLENDLTVSYIPLEKNGNGVRLADEKAAATIMDQFLERSRRIQEKDAVAQEYAAFTKTVEKAYYARLLGRRSFVIKVLNKLSGGKLLTRRINRSYPAQEKLNVQNCVACEAHRELLLNVLDDSG